MTATLKPVALYSHEWGIRDSVPIFNGGLGILNGCILDTAADLGYPLVGVGIMFHQGFLKQTIEDNRQVAHPQRWNPENEGFELLPQRARIRMYNQDVTLAAWRTRVASPVSGKSVDLLLLDSDLAENPENARTLSQLLYDDRVKLAQNVMLGIGGPIMLQQLGYDIGTHHMQEGHAAALVLKLMRDYGGNIDRVREACVFTNHTPVEAGMPKFLLEDVKAAIGYLLPSEIGDLATLKGQENLFNTNMLAAKLSRHSNAVSRLHAEVLQQMPEFQGITFGCITNGVHWRFMSGRMQNSIDSAVKYAGMAGDWRTFPELLRQVNLAPEVLRAVHAANKQELVDFVNDKTPASLKS
ncbi:MAG TPA: glycogen/starch/alpha-glucan phosphorylase, partial [Candidatus Nanoarchaeia archaeon]|nr:glycogen/starch/alpha-glucan phosphorylase [Candidatus Nanoarchaeia archaeon]